MINYHITNMRGLKAPSIVSGNFEEGRDYGMDFNFFCPYRLLEYAGCLCGLLL